MKKFIPLLLSFLFLSCDEDKLQSGSSSGRILIPSAFTPDSDELNDQFKPVFRAGSTYQLRSYEFSIYNSERELIFETTDTAEAWSGRDDNNDLLSGGSYIFKIKADYNDNLRDNLKGFVTLLIAADE